MTKQVDTDTLRQWLEAHVPVTVLDVGSDDDQVDSSVAPSRDRSCVSVPRAGGSWSRVFEQAYRRTGNVLGAGIAKRQTTSISLRSCATSAAARGEGRTRSCSFTRI